MSKGNQDSGAEGGTAKGMLRVICKRGDDRLNWNEQDALGGDAEALAAIREAVRIFALERSRDGRAYRLEASKLVGRLEQFDLQDAQIIIVIIAFCVHGWQVVDSYRAWFSAKRWAGELLLAVLTPEQYRQLMRHGYIDIPSPRDLGVPTAYHGVPGLYV